MAATRFYFQNVEVAAVSPAFDASWNVTTGAGHFRMRRIKTGTPFTTVTVSESSALPTTALVHQWVSDPISAQTISGNLKGQALIRELTADADASFDIVVRVVSNNGATVRGTLLNTLPAVLTNEPGTVLMNLNAPPSSLLTSVVAQANDRIVVEVGFEFFNLIASVRRAQYRHGDRTTWDLPEDQTFISDDCPWVEFDSAITEATPSNSFSRFYFCDTTPKSFDPTPSVPQSTTSFQGGTFTPSLMLRKDRQNNTSNNKTIPVVGISDSSYWKGTGHFSDFLLGGQVVPAGTWTVKIRGQSTPLTAFQQGVNAYLYVLKSDGTKGTFIGSGLVLFVTASAENKVITISGAGFTTNNLDRIGVELEGYDNGNSSSAPTITFQLNNVVNSHIIPPVDLLLATGVNATFQGDTEFPLAGQANVWAELGKTPPNLEQTISIITKVKNASASVTNKVQCAIYSNQQVGGQDNPAALVIQGAEVALAKSFSGEVTLTVSTKGLSANTKYWIVVQFSDIANQSLFYYNGDGTGDIPTRQFGWTDTYGTFTTNPSGVYSETVPDHQYLLFQPPASGRSFGFIFG